MGQEQLDRAVSFFFSFEGVYSVNLGSRGTLEVLIDKWNLEVPEEFEGQDVDVYLRPRRPEKF